MRDLTVLELTHLLRWFKDGNQLEMAKAELRSRNQTEIKQEMIEMIRSSDRWLRELGLRGIWALEPVELELIIPLLFDEDLGVAKTASWVFYQSPTGYNHVKNILNNPQTPEHVKVLCVHALASFQEKALEDMLEITQNNPSSQVLIAILEKLPVCILQRKHRTDDFGFSEVVEKQLEISQIKARSQKILPVYQPALEHSDTDVRLTAAIFLSQMGDLKALTILGDVIVSPVNPEFQLKAAITLVKQMRDTEQIDEQALKVIIYQAMYGNKALRINAQLELSRLIHIDKIRFYFLQNLSECVEPQAKLQGLRVLSRQCTDEVIATHLLCLWHHHKTIRSHALGYLKNLPYSSNLHQDFSNIVRNQKYTTEEVGVFLAYLVQIQLTIPQNN